MRPFHIMSIGIKFSSAEASLFCAVLNDLARRQHLEAYDLPEFAQRCLDEISVKPVSAEECLISERDIVKLQTAFDAAIEAYNNDIEDNHRDDVFEDSWVFRPEDIHPISMLVKCYQAILAIYKNPEFQANEKTKRMQIADDVPAFVPNIQ